MEPRDRRVLVALDPSSATAAASATAADLAVALGASLSAVFVEDVALVRAAMLPFSRLVHDTGESRGLDVVSVETALRAAVARARDELERTAGLARLAFSFRVARGGVLATLQQEAQKSDLVVIGSASRASVSAAVAPDSARPSQRAAPLAVVLGEPAQNAALLEVVDAMVQAGGGPITSYARDRLPDASTLAQRLSEQRVRALVAALDDPWISDVTLRTLRRRAACSIILVR